LLTVNFTELSDEEFYRLLFEANQVLIEDYFEKQKRDYVDMSRKLYFEKDVTFRGFRQT
jgi:anaerobic magnesium-protoporphyrin IX monomethyl ester cyclase